MTKSEIFKTLIDILTPSKVRNYMENDFVKAHDIIFPKVQEAGLTVLGMGMYALVVEHPCYPGRAFKVTTSKMDGFRSYAQYCIEHAGEPFIPTIHTLLENGRWGMYELDKYYPIVKPSTGYEEFINLKIEGLYTYAHAGQYTSSDGVLDGTPEQIAIYKLSERLKKEFENRFTMDIHTGNIMVDADGEVFITDPLGGELY